MDGTKWRAIQGKNPTKRDLATWTQAHFIHFLRFCEFFISYSEDGNTSKISVTKEKWKNSEQFLAMPDHPFQEFLFRINKFTFDPNADEKKFYFKLISMTKFVLGYLRSNPGVVSDEMRKIIEPHPRLAWCLTSTRIIDSIAGPIVVPDKMDLTATAHTQAAPIAPMDKQVQDVLLKAVSLFEQIANSITPEEIKKMDTKDKLIAMGRFFPLFNFAKNFKPNKQVFKQLVINNAKREDLEAAMLSMNKED